MGIKEPIEMTGKTLFNLNST